MGMGDVDGWKDTAKEAARWELETRMYARRSEATWIKWPRIRLRLMGWVETDGDLQQGEP